MEQKAASEKRQHPRIAVNLAVNVFFGSVQQTMKSQDISDGGGFLSCPDFPQVLPSLGSIIKVQVAELMGEGGEPPMLDAKVVRITKNGIGVRFLSK